MLAQDGLRMADEGHVERGDYLGDDDGYVVRALPAQAHRQFVALVAHASGSLGDELHGFRLHVRGVARKSARHGRLGYAEFVGNILYSNVF